MAATQMPKEFYEDNSLTCCFCRSALQDTSTETASCPNCGERFVRASFFIGILPSALTGYDIA